MALAATLFVSKRLTAVAAALLCLATAQLAVKAIGAPGVADVGSAEIRVAIGR